MTDSASQWPYNYPINACFIVENIITNSNKTIRIFDYPIPVGQTRDLMAIPNIDEAEIRASLLKGTLRNKLLAKEIRIVCSDIDLLQFNDSQKVFLTNAGIIDGLEVASSGGISDHETLRQLIHLADGIGGPMEGFLSGAFREILPDSAIFPTNIIWWESSAKLKKIVEKTLVYDDIQRPLSITWQVYASNGILLSTVIDTINYNGSSPFESTRVRTIS